jgi:hypothetical protein
MKYSLRGAQEETMRTSAPHWFVVGLLLISAALSVTGQQADPAAQGFGFGGLSAGLFMPDLAPVNTYLIDNDLEPFSSPFYTFGGRGRGGVLGGISAGGLGWGGSVVSRTGSIQASLAMGFGGVEIGHVVGGDERSLLTVGIVLGAGGVGLSLRDTNLVPPPCPVNSPAGCLPMPLDLHAGRIFLAVEPFLSMQVQPLGILGFEIHLGWLIPLLGFQWASLPALPEGPPILDLGGPFVSLSVTWGAFGPVGRDASEDEETTRHVVPFDATCIEVDNPVGMVAVTTSPEVSAQTGSGSAVEVIVTRRARSSAVREAIIVDFGTGECGLKIGTEGPRRWGWSVEYKIIVPPGTEIVIDQGAGDVELRGLDGSADVQLGAGEVCVTDFAGESLAIDCGVGDVLLAGTAATTASINVGTGDVSVYLAEDAALTVNASSGVGDVSIGAFPGVAESSATGFGNDVTAVFGSGAGTLAVNVGVGSVTILPDNE